jgi:hypothetical protein
MLDPDTSPPIEAIRIYEGDELVFDGSDPSSYTIIATAEDLAAFQAKIMAMANEDEEQS